MADPQASSHHDFCLGWFTTTAVDGSILLVLYVWQFLTTTMPIAKRTPLKRMLQGGGMIGSVLFLLAWLEPSGECAGLFWGDTFDVVGQFCSDGLSSLFVLEYILTTSTFLHAVATVTGASRACLPVLNFFSVSTVLCWLTVDSVVVIMDLQYPRAIFYWWLMLAMWVAFLHCCMVAVNLSRVILGSDDPPRTSHNLEQSTLLLVEQRVARARRILKDLIFLLVCTSLVLGLATWMWVTDGIRVWMDRETRGSPPITMRLVTHVVFCGCHFAGLVALLWFIWLPPGKYRFGKRPHTQAVASRKEDSYSTEVCSDTASEVRREPSQHQKKFAEEHPLHRIDEVDDSSISSAARTPPSSVG